jgi:RNA polymerase sigma-70 factor (ECF subfamily)
MRTVDMSVAIEAAVGGDEEAFVLLWREYQPILLRFLHSQVAAEDAFDVTSAVWLDVVRRLHKFVGGEGEFRAWVFTLARRRAIDLHRYRSRHPEELQAEVDDRLLDSASEDPEVELDTRESTDEILALIETLPHSEAEVVLLRVVADLDVSTVAGIVGKRSGTVRVLSHRGMERLRSAMAQQELSPTAKASCR